MDATFPCQILFSDIDRFGLFVDISLLFGQGGWIGSDMLNVDRLSYDSQEKNKRRNVITSPPSPLIHPSNAMAGAVRQPIDVPGLERYLQKHVSAIRTPLDVKQVLYFLSPWTLHGSIANTPSSL